MGSGLNDQHAGFVALATELRKMGATRVRDGGLEVVFAPVEPEEPRPSGSERVDYRLELAKQLVAEQMQERGS